MQSLFCLDGTLRDDRVRLTVDHGALACKGALSITMSSDGLKAMEVTTDKVSPK